MEITIFYREKIVNKLYSSQVWKLGQFTIFILVVRRKNEGGVIWMPALAFHLPPRVRLKTTCHPFVLCSTRVYFHKSANTLYCLKFSRLYFNFYITLCMKGCLLWRDKMGGGGEDARRVPEGLTKDGIWEHGEMAGNPNFLAWFILNLKQEI